MSIFQRASPRCISVIRSRDASKKFKEENMRKGPQADYEIVIGSAMEESRHATRADLPAGDLHAAALIDAGAAACCIETRLPRRLRRHRKAAMQDADLSAFSCSGQSSALKELAALAASCGELDFVAQAYLIEALPSSLLLGCVFLFLAQVLIDFCR